MFPCNREETERCDPHPGHFNPVITQNGHLGKKGYKLGSILKNITSPVANKSVTTVISKYFLCFTNLFFFDIVLLLKSKYFFSIRKRILTHKSTKTLIFTKQ